MCMVKRKMLHIEESVANDFRNLAKATNKDQSDLLRLLMTEGKYESVTTFEKITNRIEGEN